MVVSKKTVNKEKEDSKKCGIIMPIGDMTDYPENHWNDVLTILKAVLEKTEFDASLVSDADDVTIIHKSIIHNLYHNDIVVCDVSGKNPNVMFELGMRLAFDKPTIIIKDNETQYSFDTGIIEHLTYPKDLRFNEIVEFKQKLEKKIIDTYNKSQTDPEYSTFLKHFGELKVAEIDEKETTISKYILSELDSIKYGISQIKKGQNKEEKNKWYSNSLKNLNGIADLNPGTTVFNENLNLDSNSIYLNNNDSLLGKK